MTTSAQKRRLSVGFVGLGDIGKPMALRLAAAGGIDLHVFDVAPEPVAELHEAGAVPATSVSSLAANMDVLCVMVRDDDQVRDVLGQVLGVSGDRLTVATIQRLRRARPSSSPTRRVATESSLWTLPFLVVGWALPTGPWQSWLAVPTMPTTRWRPR